MTSYHKTILVVEDDEADRFLIERGFRENGITNPVRFVEGAFEAIAYLMGEGKFTNRQDFPFPTFIMADLKMPQGNGFELLEHIRNNPEWKVIPTVIWTASQDPDDVKKAYMLGASCYHVKPFHYPALRNQLKILHDYWMTCLIPAVDSTGRQLMTESKGKLGEKFIQPSGGTQTRKKPDEEHGISTDAVPP